MSDGQMTSLSWSMERMDGPDNNDEPVLNVYWDYPWLSYENHMTVDSSARTSVVRSPTGMGN